MKTRIQPVSKKRGIYIAPIPSFDGLIDEPRLQIPDWRTSRRSSVAYIRRKVIEVPVLMSYLNIIRSQVIGSEGVRPTWTSVQDKGDRAAIQMLWDRFEKDCSSSGRMTLVEMQKALVESLSVDGRVFVLHRYSTEYPLTYAVQMCSRDWHAEEKSIKTQEAGDRTIRGVIYRPSGRISGYHFYKNHTRPEYQDTIFGLSRILPGIMAGDTDMVDAWRVMDVRRYRRADDYDGDPSWMIAPIKALRDIAAVDHATITAMLAAAQKMGFVQREVGAPEPEAAGDGDDDVDARQMYTEGGRLVYLGPGESFSEFNPTAPNADATSHRKDLIRSMAAGMGIDYATLNSDAEAVNFSSIRHFSLMSRDFYTDCQQVLIDRFMRPMVHKFLEAMQMFHNLNISDASLMEAQDTKFKGRTWPWVDPFKDAKTEETLLGVFGKSPQDVAAHMGRDFDDIMDDWKTAAEKAGYPNTKEGLEDFRKMVLSRGDGADKERDSVADSGSGSGKS